MEARRVEGQALTDAARNEFQHELGVAYGSHPRQIADFYFPNEPASGAVIVFVHGGGFRNGSTSTVGHYGRPYLERGAIYVALGYRLVPDARYPDSCDDIERGLSMLAGQLASHGGDPRRIYLSGHSAGAMLAASVALRPSEQIPPSLVRGLVLISGMYDFAAQSPEVVNAAAARYVPNLSNAIEVVPEHTVVVGGDHDLPSVLPQAAAITAALRAKGGSVESFIEPAADHFQANRSFITPGGLVAESVVKMMQL
jgi:acetyl esterase/lipase